MEERRKKSRLPCRRTLSRRTSSGMAWLSTALTGIALRRSSLNGLASSDWRRRLNLVINSFALIVHKFRYRKATDKVADIRSLGCARFALAPSCLLLLLLEKRPYDICAIVRLHVTPHQSPGKSANVPRTEGRTPRLLILHHGARTLALSSLLAGSY